MSEPNEPKPLLEVHMLSQPRCAAGVRDMIAAIVRRLGFDEQSAGQVALATDEALANVIAHGYQRRDDGAIWMRVYPLDARGRPRCDCQQARGVRIVIEDEGQQVDPRTIQGRDLDDIRPGGLGVHIINHYMDEVCFEKRDGAGMRLTMIRRLASVEKAASAPPAIRPSGDR